MSDQERSGDAFQGLKWACAMMVGPLVVVTYLIAYFSV